MSADDRPRGGQTPRHVSTWSEHHRRSAGASLRRLAARPMGTSLTIAVMGLALALPLAFYLLLGNLQSLGDALGRNQTINVFLKADRSGAQAQLLAQQWKERPEVLAVTVKTPQQGIEELATMQGFSGALHALDEQNPLPYVLQVLPRTDLDAGAVDALTTQLRAENGVDLVQDAGHWRQRLDALLGLGRRVVLLLAAMLGLAALLVVGNTVRVDIASRSEEIGVLMLIGASRAFVRRPYLYAGIWYGLFGGLLAALLAAGIEYALAEPVAQLGLAYEGRLKLDALPLWLLLAVPPATALLGWIGARLVSARQLRKAA